MLTLDEQQNYKQSSIVPTRYLQEVGCNLKAARIRKDLAAEDMATILETTPSSICQKESDGTFYLEEFISLCCIYGCNPLDILPMDFQKQCNSDFLQTNLTDNLLKIVGQLQSDSYNTIDRDENGLTSLIRNSLDNMNYGVRDQSEYGKSASGKSTGNPDLLVYTSNYAKPIAVVEALKMKPRTSIKYFADHVLKTLENYNPVGLRSMYVIVYSYVPKFDNLWLKILDCLNNLSLPDSYTFLNGQVMNYPTLGTSQKAVQIELNRDGETVRLFVIAAKMP